MANEGESGGNGEDTGEEKSNLREGIKEDVIQVGKNAEMVKEETIAITESQSAESSSGGKESGSINTSSIEPVVVEENSETEATKGEVEETAKAHSREKYESTNLGKRWVIIRTWIEDCNSISNKKVKNSKEPNATEMRENLMALVLEPEPNVSSSSGTPPTALPSSLEGQCVGSANFLGKEDGQKVVEHGKNPTVLEAILAYGTDEARGAALALLNEPEMKKAPPSWSYGQWNAILRLVVGEHGNEAVRSAAWKLLQDLTPIPWQIFADQGDGKMPILRLLSQCARPDVWQNALELLEKVDSFALAIILAARDQDKNTLLHAGLASQDLHGVIGNFLKKLSPADRAKIFVISGQNDFTIPQLLVWHAKDRVSAFQKVLDLTKNMNGAAQVEIFSQKGHGGNPLPHLILYDLKQDNNIDKKEEQANKILKDFLEFWKKLPLPASASSNAISSPSPQRQSSASAAIKSIFDVKDGQGNSILHFAVAHFPCAGIVDTVMDLRKQSSYFSGAGNDNDLMLIVDKTNRTIPHLIMAHCDGSVRLKFLKQLLASSNLEKIFQILTVPDKSKNSCLHYALQDGNEDLIKQVLEYFSKVMNSGEKAMLLQFLRGDSTKKHAESGRGVHFEGKTQNSPTGSSPEPILHHAMRMANLKGRLTIVQFLIGLQRPTSPTYGGRSAQVITSDELLSILHAPNAEEENLLDLALKDLGNFEEPKNESPGDEEELLSATMVQGQRKGTVQLLLKQTIQLLLSLAPPPPDAAVQPKDAARARPPIGNQGKISASGQGKAFASDKGRTATPGQGKVPASNSVARPPDDEPNPLKPVLLRIHQILLARAKDGNGNSTKKEILSLLEMAAGSPEMLRYLSLGASDGSGGNSILHAIAEMDPNSTDDSIQMRILELLPKLNMDSKIYTIADKNGKTILHYLAESRSLSVRMRVLDLLYEWKQNRFVSLANELLGIQDSDGNTILHRIVNFTGTVSGSGASQSSGTDSLSKQKTVSFGTYSSTTAIVPRDVLEKVLPLLYQLALFPGSRARKNILLIQNNDRKTILHSIAENPSLLLKLQLMQWLNGMEGDGGFISEFIMSSSSVQTIDQGLEHAIFSSRDANDNTILHSVLNFGDTVSNASVELEKPLVFGEDSGTCQEKSVAIRPVDRGAVRDAVLSFIKGSCVLESTNVLSLFHRMVANDNSVQLRRQIADLFSSKCIDINEMVDYHNWRKKCADSSNSSPLLCLLATFAESSTESDAVRFKLLEELGKWQFPNEETVRNILLTKDGAGKTFLHRILESNSYDVRMKALHILKNLPFPSIFLDKDPDGRTILHRLASIPWTFSGEKREKMLLEIIGLLKILRGAFPFNSMEEILLGKETIDPKNAVLHHIAQNDSSKVKLELWKFLKSLHPSPKSSGPFASLKSHFQPTQALNESMGRFLICCNGGGNTVLHLLTERVHDHGMSATLEQKENRGSQRNELLSEIFQLMLDSQSDLVPTLEMISTAVNRKGSTFVHNALEEAPEGAGLIIRDWLVKRLHNSHKKGETDPANGIFSIKDGRKRTILHMAMERHGDVAIGSMKVLAILYSKFPKIAMEILTDMECGTRILHTRTIFIHGKMAIEQVLNFLASLKKSDRDTVLKLQNGLGATVLHDLLDTSERRTITVPWLNTHGKSWALPTCQDKNELTVQDLMKATQESRFPPAAK